MLLFLFEFVFCIVVIVVVVVVVLVVLFTSTRIVVSSRCLLSTYNSDDHNDQHFSEV